MTSPVRRLLAALGASVFSAWIAHAQGQPQPQQPAPPPRPPVFRAGSVLVTVDVYPQQGGRLVEGLTVEDFQLLEDGKPQAIDGLELVRVERTLSDAERRDPNSTREMWSEAADPRNRVFLVYLDTLHVTIEGAYQVRRPLVTMLDSLIAPNDLFGVMTPNVEARHLAFARRMESVEDQLKRYWAWGERNRTTEDPTDPVEGTLRRCYSMKPVTPGKVDLDPWQVEDDGARRGLAEILIDRRREDRVLTSLEDAVTFLTNRREARTVLVLLSDGWRLFRPDRSLLEAARVGGMEIPEWMWTGGLPKRPDLKTTSNPAVCAQELARLAQLDNLQRFRILLTQASRANISVYPVAPGGLVVFDAPINRLPTPVDPVRGSSLEIDARRVTARVESMQTIAENTDGIAIVRTNDLDRGMRRIVDDVSSYYLLTYYSSNTRHDGRYRKIEVASKRPGLTIRARRGYMAPTESQFAASTKGGGQPASDAAGPTVDAVPVDAVFAPLSRLRTGAEVFTYGVIHGDVVVVSVELGSSQLVSGPFSKGADLQVAAVTGAGPGLSSTTVKSRIEPGTRGRVVRLPVPPASGGQSTSTSVPWQVTATISAGADRLQERFEVRAGNSKLLGDPMAYRATPAASSPLRAVADFLYRRTERVHVEWPLLAAVDRKEARLIGRNGEPLPLPVTLSERSDHGQTIIAADIQLAPLAPADYAIELVVGQGATSERRYLAFRVVR
jgi:VWFA-related protein